MPKTRARKRVYSTQPGSSQQSRQPVASTQTKTTARGKKVQNPRTQAAGNLIMPSLVALGCWGLAFSFIFLTSEANHYLYGGLAVVMALMWTVMVGMRIARMRQVRPGVHR